MSDYLWDGKGAPDPEVEHLEAVLRPLAYTGRPPLRLRRRSRTVLITAGTLATAAAIALVFVLLRPRHPAPPAWAAVVSGQETRLALGEWLDTKSGRAQLRVADIGTVELEPSTRARIVATGATLHKLQLEHGALSARIDAPARLFQVATPRALVIDLGCAFALTIDEAGRGKLVVSAGQVALAGIDGREVVVAAGFECELTARGPGTPRLADVAPPAKPAPTPAPPAPRLEPQIATQRPAHSVKKTPARPMVPRPNAPTRMNAPMKTNPPARTNAPMKTNPPTKKGSGVKLDHDAFKDLERSAQ